MLEWWQSRGILTMAQTGVKQIFADNAVRERLTQNIGNISSANSINWGRLAPQIAYYFSAYHDLCGKGTIQAGDLVNFSVPTGNFGNIFGRVLCQADGVAGWAPDLCVDENNVVD